MQHEDTTVTKEHRLTETDRQTCIAKNAWPKTRWRMLTAFRICCHPTYRETFKNVLNNKLLLWFNNSTVSLYTVERTCIPTYEVSFELGIEEW